MIKMCEHYNTHMEVPKELIMFTDFLNNLDSNHHNIVRQNSIYTLIFTNISNKINSILTCPPSISEQDNLDCSDKHIKPNHAHESIDNVELHRPISTDPRIATKYTPYEKYSSNNTNTDIFYFKCILCYDKIHEQFYIYKPGSKLGQQKETYMSKIIKKLEIEPTKIIKYNNTRIDYYLVDNINKIDNSSSHVASELHNNIEILYNTGKVNCMGTIMSYREILDLYNTGPTNNIFVSICKSIHELDSFIKK